MAAQWEFNGDGKSDILWRHTTDGEVAIWLVDGTTVLQTGAIVETITPDWSIVGVADFNNDTRSDLLWLRTDGTVGIWLIDTFANVGTIQVGTASTDLKVAGVADVDGDGKPDIV